MVTAVYVSVTLAAQMLLPDATIVARKEVAFAVVGQHALGPAGLWIASLGAVLSTSSAINATLFSAARLARDVSAAGELPASLGRERDGLPVLALVWLCVLGAAFSLLPGITEIVAFGSLTFLAVFALINGMHARHTADPGLDRTLAWLAAAGCAIAATGLLYHLARSDRAALALVAACALTLGIGRGIFVRRRSPPDDSPPDDRGVRDHA